VTGRENERETILESVMTEKRRISIDDLIFNPSQDSLKKIILTINNNTKSRLFSAPASLLGRGVDQHAHNTYGVRWYTGTTIISSVSSTDKQGAHSEQSQAQTNG
jgi:hypothetical protein